ncbi:hypothetical protein [Oceanobacter mangrovi]|uniref:hypothetical protein n=1 Tax=Oceanobacter mangrovi TaxID=2862510 RepID=UPI001C8DC7D2|nr:hypothetical protein [Oceanobacter mangrovi]
MKTRLHALLLATMALSAPLSNAASAEYQQWLQRTQQQYQQYLEANDKAFLAFLRSRWESVPVAPPEQRDDTPKPVDLPVAPAEQPVDKPQPDDTPLVVLKPAPSATPEKPPVLDEKPVPEATPAVPAPITSQPVSPQPVTPQPIAPTPLVAQPTAPGRDESDVRLDYFGDSLTIRYANAFRHPRLLRKPGSDAIASSWQTLASSPHQQLVKQLKQTVNRLQLNDWGSALLFDQFVRSIGIDGDSRVISSWFLLVKAGYDARVAYDEDHVYLLVATDEPLYGVTYFTLGKKRYYSVNLNGDNIQASRVFTYEGQHDLGHRPIGFGQPNRFRAGGKIEQRQLEFDYQQQHYQLTLDLPSGYTGYYAQYPQLELASYFRAGLPESVGNELLSQLRPLIANQTELEATNRLLRFVQTAFAYETDEQQFRQENYLFPLETLHYPYSDCEDRAILFSWLVNQLLGLPTVIVSWPGHVATAVGFSSRVDGVGWNLDGQHFVLADPTFINANAGMVMPAYSKQQPKLIRF